MIKLSVHAGDCPGSRESCNSHLMLARSLPCTAAAQAEQGVQGFNSSTTPSSWPEQLAKTHLDAGPLLCADAMPQRQLTPALALQLHSLPTLRNTPDQSHDQSGDGPLYQHQVNVGESLELLGSMHGAAADAQLPSRLPRPGVEQA